jgi:hypothetical protein
MQVNVTTNPRNLSSIPKNMRKAYEAKLKTAFFRVAQIGISIIQERTERGVGYKGGRFKPYSEKYAIFRADSGRDTKPNLFFSGKMLGAITSRATSRKAEIFFSRASESAKASGNNKIRPFFGFDKEEKKRIARAFERFIQ